MAVRHLVGRMLTRAQKQFIKGIVSSQFNINPAVSFESTCELPYKVLVGTHHKTGTVWLKVIFEAICNAYSLRFVVGSPGEAAELEAPGSFDVFFHPHSRFDFDKLELPIRGLHIVRDPRDIILSGCFYHQKSSESWLHTPREYLGGRTYQEAINSRGTLEDKILFEMENAGRATIDELIRWDYTRPSFYEVKYEDLVLDADLVLFHNIFSFLGFPGSFLPGVLAIAYRSSIFSGQVSSGHVRSAEAGQWRRYFTRSHNERFLELFGDILIRLGYERGHAWATRDTC